MLATLVDVLRVAFLASMTVYTAQMMQKMGNYQMTIIDLPMNIVYAVVLFGFAVMTVRSLWVARVALAARLLGARAARVAYRRSLDAAAHDTMLKMLFLILMVSGLPVAIAMAGSSLLYVLFSGNLPPSWSCTA